MSGGLRKGSPFSGNEQPLKLDHHYRCQFCARESPAKDWKDDKCPECGRAYDPMLAQEEDDG